MIAEKEIEEEVILIGESMQNITTISHREKPFHSDSRVSGIQYNPLLSRTLELGGGSYMTSTFHCGKGGPSKADIVRKVCRKGGMGFKHF